MSERRCSLRLSSLPWISDITIGIRAKKAITPKQKKVTILSSVGPARPTPFSAIAAGAKTSIVVRAETRAAAVRFTGGNLAHPDGAIGCAAMSAFEAIVLGLVQGLTEFLPISSSGHLRIVPALLGWSDPGAGFTAVIQLGTMAAVVIYFRADLWRIAVAWLRELRVPIRQAGQDAKLGWFIVLGTIPISIFGIVFSSQIESGARSLYLIGSALILFSFVMVLAERVGTRRRTLTEMNGRDGLFVGMAQALALVPGVSRSGATISAGLFRGFDRVAAARYSFLLSVPAVVLSGLFELRKVGENGSPSAGATAIATLVAFVSGYLAIAWLLRYLGTHTLGIFVVYRIVLGVLVLALAATGVIS
jgi:undecaprenyl-diphosphatase